MISIEVDIVQQINDPRTRIKRFKTIKPDLIENMTCNEMMSATRGDKDECIR